MSGGSLLRSKAAISAVWRATNTSFAARSATTSVTPLSAFGAGAAAEGQVLLATAGTGGRGNNYHRQCCWLVLFEPMKSEDDERQVLGRMRRLYQKHAVRVLRLRRGRVGGARSQRGAVGLFCGQRRGGGPI